MGVFGLRGAGAAGSFFIFMMFHFIKSFERDEKLGNTKEGIITRGVVIYVEKKLYS
jgi:hypothetical protein